MLTVYIHHVTLCHQLSNQHIFHATVFRFHVKFSRNKKLHINLQANKRTYSRDSTLTDSSTAMSTEKRLCAEVNSSSCSQKLPCI